MSQILYTAVTVAAAETSGGFLDFFSIDPLEMVLVLCNTLILFLVLRHFLFGKVNAMLEQRKNDVAETYTKADEAKKSAEEMKADYTKKLSEAKSESAEIIKNATKKAQLRSDEIIFAAKDEASGIIEKANSDIEREKKHAVNQIKDEISEIAISVAEKVVKKEITDADNDRLIEEFIENIGDVE